MLDDLRASQDTIRELSAPVIPVLPGVLVAPLVGALDSKRAAILTENILAAVDTRAPTLLFLTSQGADCGYAGRTGASTDG